MSAPSRLSSIRMALLPAIVLLGVMGGRASAFDEPAGPAAPPAASAPAASAPADAAAPVPGGAAAPVPAGADRIVEDTKSAVHEIAEEVDRDPRAKEVSAGILQPIYQLAQAMSHPAFHWIAFAVMATGVVSYLLQLVLGKLLLLARFSFSLKEILSDALGLVISLTGLVLTTQAAAQNSTFTTSPAAVLSASGVGIVAGFIFYLWGHRQELEAARGRSLEKK